MKKLLVLVGLSLLLGCTSVPPEEADQDLNELPNYQPHAIDTPDQVEMKETEDQMNAIDDDEYDADESD